MLDINTKFTKAIHGAVDAISKRNSFCLFLKTERGTRSITEYFSQSLTTSMFPLENYFVQIRLNVNYT